MKKIILIGILVSAIFGCNSQCESDSDFDTTTTSDTSSVEKNVLLVEMRCLERF